MNSNTSLHRTTRLTLGFMMLAIASASSASPRQAKIDLLRIGATDSLSARDEDRKAEQGNLESLKGFIKDETGFKSEIINRLDCFDLAGKLAKGELHLGTFQGYEFAWVAEKYPKLKPLALGINVHRYPLVSIVTQSGNAAKDFSGLKGQTLAVPATGQSYLNLFLEQQSKANGKTAAAFFGKITKPDTAEDALDDVVDGVVQAAVADNATLDAYKRRKPGRFNKLKEVAKSQPLPPTVMACYDTVLDDATLKTFKAGLLGASKKDRGQTMLTLFRLTAFEPIPDDFGKVLADTRKTYPAPLGKTK